MIVFISSSDFNPNPRTSKYIDAVALKNMDYFVIGWDRSGGGNKREKYYFFNKKAKYGARYKNVKNKALWNMFVLKTLFIKRDKYKLIHATDFDSILPAFIFSFFYKKKLIFDIADWIGNSSNEDPLIIRMIEKIENALVKRVNTVIICEYGRKDQLSESHIRNLLVMPNIPVINSSLVAPKKTISINYDYVISYVGVFDYNRGIENLLKFGESNKNISIHIAGYGALEELVVKAASKNSNIIFWGKVDHTRGLEIMRNSNLIYASYYLTNPVHLYAAPNKFYESLACSTPIITTSNTLVGRSVEKYGTGYVIGEDYKDIVQLFETPDFKEDIRRKEVKCKNVWENKYKNYINEFMELEFIPLLEKLEKEV